jgi:hypothetical protein
MFAMAFVVAVKRSIGTCVAANLGVEPLTASRLCVVPGDGVEPSVHGFTDRCLDHLATLGRKGFRLKLARHNTRSYPAVREPNMAAAPAGRACQ